jgi:hypothetical protein
MKKILQITPANDWFASYKEDGEDKYYPLACWALCEEDGTTGVEGVSAGQDGLTDICNESRNFVGYFHKSEIHK